MTTLASRCAGAQRRKLVPPPAISAPTGRQRVLLVFAKTRLTAASAVRVAWSLLFFEAEDLCTTTTAAEARKLDRRIARRGRKATPSSTPRAAAFITATTPSA